MILLTNPGSKLDEELLAHHRGGSLAYVDVLDGKGRAVASPVLARGKAYRIEAFERRLVTHWQVVDVDVDVADTGVADA